MRTSRYAFPGGVSRTVIVEDPERAVVFSPGAPLVTEARALTEKSVVLVAPSVGHVSGIASWSAALPSARVVASGPTAKRLTERGVEIEDPSRVRLPQAVQLRVPPGSKLGEIWMRVEDSSRVHWVVCDAFTNIERLSPSLWLRAVQWLYGLRTGLRVSPALRRSMTDTDAFRTWLRAEVEDGCDTLIPCHGEIDDRPDLAVRLERCSTGGWSAPVRLS